MQRRDFLTIFSTAANYDKFAPTSKPIEKIQSGLDKYTTALDRKNALHLLRRLTFGPTPTMIDKIVGKTADEAVALILGDGTTAMPNVPDASWTKTPQENPLDQIAEIQAQIEGTLNNNYTSFIDWWIELMRAEDLPTMEKFTLFLTCIWSIAFHYDTLALMPTPLMLQNNMVLRLDRFDQYKSLAMDISLNGAMIMYQSLYYSTAAAPNENYIREMMELFTMGIGNYTQGNIRQGAKLLTGWRTSPYFGDPGPKGYFNTYFSPQDHDIGSKTIMGTVVPARDQASNTEDQVKSEEVQTLLDILFSNRQDAISTFVSGKIYRFFVYSNPGYDSSSIVSDMATGFLSNNFSLRSAFETLFTSQHFFDDAVKGIQIKTPPEFIIGLERQLGTKYSNAQGAIDDLEQALYDPPNVGSWKAYHTWISTKTYPLRISHGNQMVDNTNDSEIFTLIKQFTGYDVPDTLVVALEEYFFPVPVDSGRHTRYKNSLLQSANTDDNGWGILVNAGNNKAAQAVRDLIKIFIKAPDFHLC